MSETGPRGRVQGVETEDEVAPRLGGGSDGEAVEAAFEIRVPTVTPRGIVSPFPDDGSGANDDDGVSPLQLPPPKSPLVEALIYCGGICTVVAYIVFFALMGGVNDGPWRCFGG